jgi:hypothetical protein
LVSINTFTVDILVAGKIEFMKIISLEIVNLTTSIYVNNYEMSCNVTKRGFYESLHCYNIDFSFLFAILEVDLSQKKLYCLVSKIDRIYSLMLYNIKIVVMEQIVLVLSHLTNLTIRLRD